jgi:hypothetical protein
MRPFWRARLLLRANQLFLFVELYRVTIAKGQEIVEPRAPGWVVVPKQKTDLTGLLTHFGVAGR